MSRRQLFVTLSGGVVLSVACAAGSPPSFSGSGRGLKAAGSPSDYTALGRAYRVAPDRASIRVDVIVESEQSATARSQLRARIGAVEQAVAGACAATLLDYATTHADPDDDFRSAAEIRVDVPLVGMESVPERMDALDACDAALAPALTPGEGAEAEGHHAWVLRSAQATLIVDEPALHVDALLEAKSAELSAVSAPEAPQLHPEDLRCTPTGAVHHGDRRLSGVELRLELDCTVEPEPPASPQPPAPVSSRSVY